MNFCLQVVKQTLLKEAEKGFERNIACSPLSINALSNMLAVGSNGKTLEQFLGFLGSKSVADLNKQSMKLMAAASDGGSSQKGGPLLSCVNGVWLDERFTLKPSFLQILKSVFTAETNAVDFFNKPDEVREVNSLAQSATKGLIKEIIPHGSVDKSTTLILANALYFKGAWRCAFDASKTKDRSFYLLSGETVQVPYMCHTSERYLYGSFEGFKLLKMPYQNGEDERRFSMYVFLPHERAGLQNLLQQFNSNPELLNQGFGLYPVKVDRLMIPKFKFSYHFEVSERMKELGLTLPFANGGELTEMVDFPSGEPFRVEIFHKAYIEVNEKGTEAAAITLALTHRKGYYCLQSPPPRNFIADHPFMFMIRDDVSGIPFFIGAVLNPLLD